MDRITRKVLATAFSLGLVAMAANEATAQVADAPAASSEITIELKGSDAAAAAAGEAVIAASGEQTQVVIDVAKAPADAALRGFLVAGRCGESQDVIAELGAIEAEEDGSGALRAVVPVDLETIAAAPVSVELRQAQLAVACGEHLALATEIEEAPAAAPAPRAPMTPSAPAPAESPALPAAAAPAAPAAP